MADHGHYGVRAENRSRQGTYVFTAQGKFLASINDLSANRMLAMMQKGLYAWNALPESEKATNQSTVKVDPKHRWEDFYPRDGLVLTSYSRDLIKNGKPTSKPLGTWNRDSAWFSKSEVEEMLPVELKTGQTFQFSNTFVERLCKLHLVDSVKGQTEHFTDDEIEGSKMQGIVTGKKKGEGELWTIAISGSTRARHDGDFQARGLETEMIGQEEFDMSKKRFTRFDLTAIGQRWGRTRFNGRRRQLEHAPIGFSFELANPDHTPIVPGIIWGYHVDWMQPPKN